MHSIRNGWHSRPHSRSLANHYRSSSFIPEKKRKKTREFVCGWNAPDANDCPIGYSLLRDHISARFRLCFDKWLSTQRWVFGRRRRRRHLRGFRPYSLALRDFACRGSTGLHPVTTQHRKFHLLFTINSSHQLGKLPSLEFYLYFRFVPQHLLSCSRIVFICDIPKSKYRTRECSTKNFLVFDLQFSNYTDILTISIDHKLSSRKKAIKIREMHNIISNHK